MKWLDEIKKEDEQFAQIYSFQEYMEVFEKNPRRECRTNSIYLKDMFDFFGKDDRGAFKLFTKEYNNSVPIFGQIKTQNEIYRNLINAIEEGHNNKFILLIGPNGSSKSSLVKKMMLGAQDYSKSEDGALYTFSWIFPVANYIKGTLGLGAASKTKELNTFAKLDDQEITAILPPELKDHPFLLVPLNSRRKLIDELLLDYPDILESVQKSYLYNGDLSKKNRMIFDALLKSYKGDYTEVFKHIRVERFVINKRYSIGAATIEPQLHVDARLQQITMDKRLASLPPSLQSLNLFSLNGEMVLSNRGILEYSDLLKRPLDTYKYLLMTMESKSINLQGILTELDIFFIGSSNEIHFTAFMQHPDFNSFKGRFNFVKVPYLLNYRDEIGIYNDQLGNIKEKTNFEPHALKTLCLWAVMTRLRASQAKNYKDKKLGLIVEKMNPLEKALFLSDKTIPARYSVEQTQRLDQNSELIDNEFSNDPQYQGKFGISPREIKQLIYKLSAEDSNITFIGIIEFLKKLIEKKTQHDFLNIAPQGDFHNNAKFLELLEASCLSEFDNELRDSLGLVDDRSYEDYIRKYIHHVNALIKGEKIKNSMTGKSEKSDMFFIKEFEINIKLKEDPEKYRSHLISKLGAFSLDNPGIEIVYVEIFSDLAKSLQESFRQEQHKMIGTISNNLVFFQLNEEDPKSNNSINADAQELIANTIDNLISKYHYSKQGAYKLIKFVIKKNYEKS
ncbi:hypothetical protein N9B72_00540 [Bacteriovoracaceae bacterium]|nr:hypothetical protein [Bacteriovoracaceae bacterium]